jgi:hypothetical protein
LPNLEGEDGGAMEPGKRMGRRRKHARSIPVARSLERVDDSADVAPLGRYSVEERGPESCFM